MENINWDKIAKEALGWLYNIIIFAFPWMSKVIDVFGKIIVLTEIGGQAVQEQKPQKLQTAVDNFEKYLVEQKYIPPMIESAFDPILDWALKEMIKALVGFLDKTFGKNWIDVFKQNKIPDDLKI